MSEMATRSIPTLIDRLRGICNELICVKRKKKKINVLWHFQWKECVCVYVCVGFASECTCREAYSRSWMSDVAWGVNGKGCIILQSVVNKQSPCQSHILNNIPIEAKAGHKTLAGRFMCMCCTPVSKVTNTRTQTVSVTHSQGVLWRADKTVQRIIPFVYCRSLIEAALHFSA